MSTSIHKPSAEAPICEPCRSISKVTKNADYRCEECNHSLCKTCLVHHQRTLMTRKHHVVMLKTTPTLRNTVFQVSGRRPDVRRVDKTTAVNKGTQLVRPFSASTDSSTQPGTSQTGSVYKTAILQSGLNVSVGSDDGPCELNGLVLVQDMVVVCDWANSKLKVFSSDNALLYEHKCDNKPYDISNLDDTTVVVSFVYGHNMKLLSVGRDKMTELITINTEFKCTGVCCYDGKIYCVVRDDQPELFSQVRVYTPDGKLNRRFEYLSDGPLGCYNLDYITVNPQTGILYVSDWNKGVLALTTSGYDISVMPTSLLKNPEGIAVDEFGYIYVCGVNSHNVIQMSADGHDAVEMMSGNIRCRRAQCVKIYSNIMFCSRRGSDIVSLFELC